MKKIIIIYTLLMFTNLHAINAKDVNLKEVVIEVNCDDFSKSVFGIWYDRGFSKETCMEKAKEAKTACEKEFNTSVE